MNCPQCATAIPSGAAFCPKCGSRVADASFAAEATAAKPAAPQSAAHATLAAQAEAAPRRGGVRDAPEEELWVGGYSPKAMYGSWLGAIVLTVAGVIAVVMFPHPWGWMAFGIGAAAIWLGLILTFLIRKVGVRYRLTTQRFFHERGILRRITDRVEVIDIDDVRFEQGIVERMLGVGSILISSKDRSTPQLLLSGIDNVKEVADIVDKARRVERQRRGIIIDTV